LTTVFVTTRAGQRIELAAVDGDTLMQTVVNSDSSEMTALCGGCRSCATCHVYVAAPWFAKLPPLDPDEDGLLEGTQHRQDNSRLSCQIALTKELDGLEVTIAPEE